MTVKSKNPGFNGTPFIVCEIGASHNGSLERCLDLIGAAKKCGADAVKFQAFTPDTITLSCGAPEFIVQDGPWKGRQLYELYSTAYTPREWFPTLFQTARDLGLVPFASVFSPEDCDFIMQFDPEILKISSFEIIDLPLIEYVAKKGKPLFLSMGMTTDAEMWEALDTAVDAGIKALDLKVIQCTSSYPTLIQDAPLHLLKNRDGISDHSIGIEVPIAATATRLV